MVEQTHHLFTLLSLVTLLKFPLRLIVFKSIVYARPHNITRLQPVWINSLRPNVPFQLWSYWAAKSWHVVSGLIGMSYRSSGGLAEHRLAWGRWVDFWRTSDLIGQWCLVSYHPFGVWYKFGRSIERSECSFLSLAILLLFLSLKCFRMLSCSLKSQHLELSSLTGVYSRLSLP